MTYETVPLASLPPNADIPKGVGGFYHCPQERDPNLPDFLGYGSGVGMLDDGDLCLLLSTEKEGEHAHILRLKLAERLPVEEITAFDIGSPEKVP